MRLVTHVLQRNSRVYVPVVTLKRSGQTIVLIGMMHIGSRSFYREVQFLLSSLESSGHQIFYEVTDPPRAGGSEQDKNIRVEGARALDKLYASLRGQGVFSQISSIQRRTSWLSADLSPQKWRRISAHRGVPGRKEISQINGYADDPKSFMRLVMSSISHDFPAIPNKETILYLRNKVAVDRLLSCRSQKVATFWGSAHLPGMIGLLSLKGFAIRKVRFIQALDVAKFEAERE